MRTWPSSENLPTVKRKASHQRQPVEVQNGGSLVEQHGVVNRSQGWLRSRRRGAVWRGSGSRTLLGRAGVAGLLLLEGQELEGVIRSFLNAGVGHRLGLGGSSRGTRWRARGESLALGKRGRWRDSGEACVGEAPTRGWSRGSSGSRSGEKLSLLLP